jgi:ferredoxin--NADP+ reductase
MEPLATATRPLRVAVVGAGPAGLYAAEALLNKPDLVLTIDVFDR